MKNVVNKFNPDQLNPEQKDAVLHGEGPILILAGAGTGKTRTLTHRVANLVLNKSIRADQILAVTFTNKATKEMRERLSGLLGEDSERLWIATFHSAALRILRNQAHHLGYKKNFVIYDTNDSKALIKKIMTDLSLSSQDYSPGYFLSRIDDLKTDGILPDDYEPLSFHKDQIFAQVYEHYQRELMEANAMDFNDLLINCLRLLKEQAGVLKLYQRQLKYVLVDEFQDTNLIQYNIVRLLAAPENNLLVVGDDDQSIYAFRGADIRNILSFEEDFSGTKLIKLEQNYRSTQTILDASHAVIDKNKNRKAKKLWTEKSGGDKICLHPAGNELEEADFILDTIKQEVANGKDYQEFAVFYRTNAQSRALEEAFLKASIPHRIFGSIRFYERKEVKDILAYLRLINNRTDNQALSRIINIPRRGIGIQTYRNISKLAFSQSCSLFNAAENYPHKQTTAFCELINSVDENLAPAEMIRTLLEKTKYLDQFEDNDDISESAKNTERRENVMELTAVAERSETLVEFLDNIALVSSIDNISGNVTEEEDNFVSLMTLHLAKGLEFPQVFLTGMEDGLLPHVKAIESSEVPEERRLCYVGMTRAMDKLYLTYAFERGFATANSSYGYGGYGRDISRFIQDVPKEFLDEDLFYEEDDDFFDYADESFVESDDEGNAKEEKTDKKDDLKKLVRFADEV